MEKYECPECGYPMDETVERKATKGKPKRVRATCMCCHHTEILPNGNEIQADNMYASELRMALYNQHNNEDY